MWDQQISLTMRIHLLLRKVLLFLFTIFSTFAFSSNYYWVGGAGDWSDINHWVTTSGGSIRHVDVPSQYDNVIFDANSGFTAGALSQRTVNVNVTATCLDFTWDNAPNSPEITGGEELHVFGSMTLQSDMTFRVRYVRFLSSLTGNTITTNGAVLHSSSYSGSAFYFDNGGEWILQDDFISSVYLYDFNLIKGILDFNSKTVHINLFKSIGNEVRSLRMANAEVELRSFSAVVWEYTGTNKTLDAANSRIIFPYNGTYPVKFTGDLNDQYAYVSFTGALSTGEIVQGTNIKEIHFQGDAKMKDVVSGAVNMYRNGTFFGENTIDTLMLTSGYVYSFETNKTQFIQDHFKAASGGCAGMKTLQNSTPTGQARIQFQATTLVELSDANVKNISIIGVPSIDAVSSIDNGGNSGIVFQTPVSKVFYWVGGAGDWNDPSHWSTINDGVYPAVRGCVPSLIDDVVFNENSGFLTGSNAARTVNIDNQAYCHTMIWDGALNNPIISGDKDLNIYGSIALQSGMIYKVENTYFLSNALSETITTNGAALNSPSGRGNFTFDGDAKWTFLDDFITASNKYGFIFNKGILDFNGKQFVLFSFNSNGTGLRNLLMSGAEVSVDKPSSDAWEYLGTNRTLDASFSKVFLDYNGSNYIRFKGELNDHYHHVEFRGPLAEGQVLERVLIDKLIFNGRGKVNRSTLKYLEFKKDGLFENENTMDTLVLANTGLYTFPAGLTQTITRYFNGLSASCSGVKELQSSSSSPAFIHFEAAADVDLENASITNIHATGAVPVFATNSFDNGGNAGFIFQIGSGTTLYWVGGAGDWNDDSHWSTINDGVYPSVSGCIPTLADDVVFNENSGFLPGAASLRTVSVTSNAFCRDMTWNNAENNPVITGVNSLEIRGSMELQANMEFKVQDVYFTSNQQGETIRTNGAVLHSTSYSGSVFYFDNGGEWTFLDDFISTGYPYDFNLKKGTLDFNSKKIHIYTFKSEGNEPRELRMGTSEVELRNFGRVVWEYSGANRTLEARTSKIFFMYNGTSYIKFKGEPNDYYNHIEFSGANASAEVNDNLTINRLIFHGSGISNANTVGYMEFKKNGEFIGSNIADTLVLSPGGTYVLEGGIAQTVNEKLFASGNPCFVLFMKSKTSTPALLNVLSGEVLNDFANLTNIDASGSYVPLEFAKHTVDVGGNSNINFAGYDEDAEILGLGDDILLPCNFDPFAIKTDGFFPTPSTQFEWNDGTTLDSLVVTDFGKYSVKAIYADGCVVKDSMNVLLFDTIPPIIVNCPGDINQPNDLDSCGAIVTWVPPTATDNCSVNLVLSSNYTPGDYFPVGSTTVTYTAIDSSSNISTCSFVVTIEDQQAPTLINCPNHIVFNTELGLCSAEVAWDPPHAVDNCSTGAVVLTSTHQSGDVYPVGITSVTYTATDAASNSISCTFVVEVKDIEEPVFFDCPVDITLPNDINVCSASVTWIPPVATDNCSSNPVVVGTHQPDDLFPVGVTAVTYTATDSSGNIATCTFNVTVEDMEAPVFVLCPMDISVNNTVDACSATVTWIVPTATDNCSATAPVITSSHNSGAVFPVGTTTVTYTATDDSGNSATCSFNVTVIDTQLPEIINCPSNIRVDNDIDVCGAEVTWIVPTATDNCSTAPTITSTHNPGDVFPIGITIVEYLVEDTSGNRVTCSFEVNVEDVQAPVFIGCPADIFVSNDLDVCEATVTWPAPIATDNCSSTALIITNTHNSGDVFLVGVTTVTYTATDISGNIQTCSFTVTVNDTLKPVFVSCPTDISVSNDLDVCEATATWTVPTATDACSSIAPIITNTHNSGDVFPVGITTVTYTATDISGNIQTCSFTVTVNDTLRPVFVSCPTDISVSNDLDVCEATATWTVPTATDACSSTAPIITNSHNSGGVFPVGVTTVTYTATDVSGNIQTCSFTVTVNDTLKPVFVNCPADISVSNDLDVCEAIVTWIAPIATDDCSSTAPIVTNTHNSGDVFPVGVTTVTYTATDVSGNIETCSFTVTVNDTLAPVIIISDVKVSYCDGDPITWMEQITDNCSVQSIVRSHQSGDKFPVGTTSVNYTVEDASGNVTVFDFDIIVYPSPVVGIDVLSPLTVCYNKDVSVSVINPSPDLKYTWTHDGVFVNEGPLLSIGNTTEFDRGNYTVIAENSFGCFSKEVTVGIDVMGCKLLIPEAFSPNGDGKNETFLIENLELYPNSAIWIHNRWGAEVYQSDDYQNDWDGHSFNKMNVGNNLLPEGTYYYILKIGGDGSMEESGALYKGFIYLKR